MEAFQRCQTCNAKFWKALKWQRASETFIFSEDARGRGSEVVFPLNARKISQLRPRKTRLDPCSSGTSLQNTFKYHTYSEFSQFIMLPKWKPFSGTRFWKALKWDRASETFIFSEDARGKGSEMVFPFHIRQISTFIGQGNTRLDPCSLETSLGNTANFRFTQPIYNAPKIYCSAWMWWIVMIDDDSWW